MAGTGTIRVSQVVWQWPEKIGTIQVSQILWAFPLNPPLVSWRVDYTDDGLTHTSSHDSSQGPPTRKTGVLGVVFWHSPPYRDLHYGLAASRKYIVEGIRLDGETIPDGNYETYRQGLHSESHPHE